MRSRISIDVDPDNQPVIKIEFIESPDVRDKLVKKFLDSFGGRSSWASFFTETQVSMAVANKIATIRPIHPTDLPREVKAMRAEADLQQKALDNLNKQFPSHE